MLNIVYGDTILFEATLKDAGGTAVTNAVGSLSVTDFLGSVVLATHVTHTTGGTYSTNQNTTAWGLGPIQEKWTFTNSSGTKKDLAFGNYRITGTVLPTAYIFTEELSSYFENVIDYFDGDEEAHVLNAKAEIDSRLRSLGVKLPITPKSDGFYDQALRDLNGIEAVIRIVSKRQQGYNIDGNREPWYMGLRKEADRIFKGIESNKYTFERDISAAEGGISVTTKTDGGTNGQMDVNWRGGVGAGFSDSSYSRDWTVKIIGTGTSGGIAECLYTWSNNGGISVNGTHTTSLEWNELTTGVFTRFFRGSNITGTTGLYAVNDTWTFKTSPRSQAMAGNRVARSY